MTHYLVMIFLLKMPTLGLFQNFENICLRLIRFLLIQELVSKLSAKPPAAASKNGSVKNKKVAHMKLL